MTEVIRRLRSITHGSIVEYVDLRTLGRWRIGGTGRVLIEPTSDVETCNLIKYISTTGIPYVVIGDGSNILFDDAGFDGILIRIGRAMAHYEIRSYTAFAQAGVWVPLFVRALCRAGLAGAQHAIGIPGTLGGLVMMNGGSQRNGIGSNITKVRGCNTLGEPFELTQEECSFRYRSSILQDRALIVLETEFSFTEGDPARLRREMINLMRSRRLKFPKHLPNCGSVFLSDPAMYATVGPPGLAIEQAGLKGFQCGRAQISPLHANFIVNLGGAQSSDVLQLINSARTAVYKRSGFWLNCEVRHVSPNGLVRPAHMVTSTGPSIAENRPE